MKFNLFGLFSGVLFGLGLILAGMANPVKVQGFLDIAGLWDPSLAFVMGGGIGVSMVFYAKAKRTSLSLLTKEALKVPSNTLIDKRLVLGSAAFGIGWGIGGICPGPALVAVGMGSLGGVLFTVAMLVGMYLFEIIERRNAKA
ncbi:YeeE/YedE family protein [Chitinibacter bivalviorum]|uniref:YeeE/YedE family protein n=1 Tax=Chitinibacter bivalviorum TaxID=2739434 RepID=A0A7H9BI08_9NEIS|nr:DUF6691 family protein [Chitinibacter bivalviorum]QLG87838.1 YeeE/YedE family protein [Chitinibacter bivalviorum]